MLVLTDSDKLSPTWLKLKAHYVARLATMKHQLPQLVVKGMEQPALELAARMLEIQDLLALDQDHAT